MLCERVCDVAALTVCGLLSQGDEVQELAVPVVPTCGRPTAKTSDANEEIFINCLAMCVPLIRSSSISIFIFILQLFDDRFFGAFSFVLQLLSVLCACVDGASSPQRADNFRPFLAQMSWIYLKFTCVFVCVNGYEIYVSPGAQNRDSADSSTRGKTVTSLAKG